MATNKAAKAATAGNSKKAAKGRPFEKGKSGNPSGRPKIPKDVKEMLKAASVDAAKLLIDTANDDKVKIELRIDCAKTILDRVYGKATQPIDGSLEGGLTITLGPEVVDYAK